VSAEEVAAQFPRLAIRGPAVLDPSGGVLRADRALHVLRSTMQAASRVDHCRKEGFAEPDVAKMMSGNVF